MFSPHGHGGSSERRHTITTVGSEGLMGLVGNDWSPLGADLATHDKPKLERHCADAQRSACARARSGRMSQTHATSTNGEFVSTGRYECDTLPNPITPVRTRPGVCAITVKPPAAIAALVTSVAFVKARRFIVPVGLFRTSLALPSRALNARRHANVAHALFIS